MSHSLFKAAKELYQFIIYRYEQNRINILLASIVILLLLLVNIPREAWYEASKRITNFLKPPSHESLMEQRTTLEEAEDFVQ